MKYSDDQLKGAYDQAREFFGVEEGTALSIQMYDRWYSTLSPEERMITPSPALYLRRYSRWSDFLAAHGMPMRKGRTRSYSRRANEDLLKWLEMFFETEGKPLGYKPTVRQYDEWSRQTDGAPSPSLLFIRTNKRWNELWEDYAETHVA